MIQNSYYSPFTNDKNDMLSVYEIKFDDLKQLKDKEIEEGFQIEYKSTYNSDVKSKLPKIITSFANEHGGWLFIGIDENTKDLLLVPKLDYEIQIQQIIKSNTSPFPKSFIRFLHPDSNDSEGVIVVWVPEGDDPPYIAKGRIYRRGGSGSDPIKEIEDRYYIDKLYQKSHLNKEKIKDFCKKEISIYNRYWPSGLNAKDYVYMGMCDLYFIPAFGELITKKIIGKDIADYIIKESHNSKTYRSGDLEIAGNIPFEKYSFSHESIIFRNSKDLRAFDSTAGFELFFNLSAKFHYPILYVNKESIVAKISNLIKDDKDILKKFEFIDGIQLISVIFNCIGLYSQVIQKFNEQNQDFLLIIKIYDVKNNVLFFDTPIFEKFIENFGLFFSDKTEHFITFDYHYDKIQNGDLTKIFSYISPVFNAFGIRSSQGFYFYISGVNKKHNK